jgi:type II secretory pathway component GspD/PulD (secretin)
VVGALAGGLSNKKRIRRELVVMIQPVVVESNEEMARASDKEGGRTDLGVRSKNLREKLQPTPTPQKKKQWYQKMFEPRKLDNF